MQIPDASAKAQPFIDAITKVLKDESSKITPSILQNTEALFLVIGPGYFGYGTSLKDAKAECIKAGCPRKAKMLAFAGDDSIGVNDFGSVSAERYLIGLGEI